MNKPVIFVWPGDLHLESADRPNYKTALWAAEEINDLIKPDFVQFAGDNVQHARDDEFALFEDVWGKLKVPWHALVGDHDAHHDPGAVAHQARFGQTYFAFTVGGFRFICLNTMQFKPLGMSEEQLIWFRYEADAALVRGERIIVFQHHYPFQVWEDFGNQPGMATWREIVQTRPITALFAGHTHYGQIANDGHHVYVATRSIGEPEGGPAGYAVVFLEGDDLALAYRSVEDTGPVVLITHPRRLVLATSGSHIVTGPVEGRVRAWSASPVTEAEVKIDKGEWSDLRGEGDLEWSFPIPGDKLAKGEHLIQVRLTDESGAVGTNRIPFFCDRSGRFNPFPMTDPVIRETKFC